MAEATKEEITEVHKDVKLLRDAVESKNAHLSETLEKVERINRALDAAEVKNEKVSGELASAMAKITDLGDLQEKMASGEAEATKTIAATQAQISALEADVARGVLGAGQDCKAYRESPEGKAFEVLVREGEKSHHFTPEVKALLRTDNQVVGGYLTQNEYSTEMIKFITEFSNMRAISSVRTTSEKSMSMPVRATLGEAFYEGEAEQNSETNSTYGIEEMFTYRLSSRTPVTMDQLMNSAFDMDTEITSDTAEFFEKKEGLKFVLGTGVKQPKGFLAEQSLIDNARDTIASGVLDSDSILLVQGDLKRGQNPRFAFNRQTLATARTLKGSTNDHYLWSPALDGGAANMLAGSPYTILQDMPAIANGSLSIAYGDFVRGYRILDRTGMIMVRDDLTQADSAIVKFVFHRWNNGQVINAEAIKILRIAA